MMSRRPPSDGDSSPPVTLPRTCRAIGAELAEVRAARALPVEDVARQLLLSKGQVLGLEQADASPFYGPRYFLKGLRKYMAFAGIPDDRLHEPDPGEPADEDNLRLTLAAETAPAPAPVWWARRPGDRAAWVGAAALAGVVFLVAGAFSVWPSGSDTVSLTGSAPLPAEPLGVPVATAPAVHAVPAAMIVGAEDGSTVRLSVGKATWVFVRFPDNRVVERRLEAGEEIEVGPLPVYLAVGTADSVELHVEDRPIALGPYIRNGQVRITRPELAKLVP